MRISDWSSDVCSSDLAVPGAAAGRAGAAGAAARRRAADRAAGRRRRHSGAAGAVPRCDDLAAPGGAQACRCAWPDGGAGREDAGVSGLAVRHEWSELDVAQRAATLARPARPVPRELSDGVAAIIDQVRASGDAALRELTLRLDGADLEDLSDNK